MPSRSLSCASCSLKSTVRARGEQARDRLARRPQLRLAAERESVRTASTITAAPAERSHESARRPAAPSGATQQARSAANDCGRLPLRNDLERVEAGRAAGAGTAQFVPLGKSRGRSEAPTRRHRLARCSRLVVPGGSAPYSRRAGSAPVVGADCCFLKKRPRIRGGHGRVPFVLSRSVPPCPSGRSLGWVLGAATFGCERRLGARGSVVAQWRPEQRHVVLFEDGCDDGSVGCAVAGCGSQLFVEVVPAAGRVHHDDLGRRVGQVQEGVWNLGRQVREAAFIECEELLPILTLKRPLRTWIVSSCLWWTCSGGPPCGRLRP